MDQALLDYLMEMGAMKPQEQKLAQRRSLVSQLRQRGAQPLQMRNAGRLQVGPHPLEALGSLANTAVGEYQNQQANEMEGQMGAQRRDALTRWRNNMTPGGSIGGIPGRGLPGDDVYRNVRNPGAGYT